MLIFAIIRKSYSYHDLWTCEPWTVNFYEIYLCWVLLFTYRHKYTIIYNLYHTFTLTLYDPKSITRLIMSSCGYALILFLITSAHSFTSNVSGEFSKDLSFNYSYNHINLSKPSFRVLISLTTKYFSLFLNWLVFYRRSGLDYSRLYIICFDENIDELKILE